MMKMAAEVFSHCAADSFRFVAIGLAGLLSAEFPRECAGKVNEAGASCPPSSAFFKLARTEIFGVYAFAFDPVTSVQLSAIATTG